VCGRPSLITALCSSDTLLRRVILPVNCSYLSLPWPSDGPILLCLSAEGGRGSMSTSPSFQSHLPIMIQLY